MKKLLCCLAAALALLLLAGCAPSVVEKASKDCDQYVVVCSYDEETHTLSAVQTVTAENRSANDLDSVKFHIYANQYREGANPVVPASYKSVAYPNGDSWGEIVVDGAKVEGEAVPFTIEGQDFDVLSLPAQWRQGKKVTAEITYTVTLANVRHRLGWTENTVNLGNFFPVLCAFTAEGQDCTPYYNVGDPFVSDVANFDVTLSVNDKYVVAASGALAEASQLDGGVKYRYTAQAVRDFALVMSDKYKKISKNVGEVTVSYYYFADSDAETTLDRACGALAYFSEKIAPYPYAHYSVCETEFCYGGMEYPCLSMVSSGGKYYADAVIHETAHQWFYGVVGNDQIRSPWMDEGLAEFLTCLYMDYAQITPLSQSVLNNVKTYTTYVDVLNNYYHDVDTTFRSLDKFANDNEYVVMTYVKGSLLFNTLYETLGERKFFAALSDYYDKCAMTVATPQQMTDSFCKVGGKETASIFHSYAQGKEIIGQVTD